jgi:hypothetical protein
MSIPKLSAVLVATLTIAASPALPKVMPMPLHELFWESEIVAVGRDIRIFRAHGWQVAEFEIARVLKGSPTARAVYYLADATWTCDISTASPGERSLIFLRRMGPPSRDRIAAIYSSGSSAEAREPPPETVNDSPYTWSLIPAMDGCRSVFRTTESLSP